MQYAFFIFLISWSSVLFSMESPSTTSSSHASKNTSSQERPPQELCVQPELLKPDASYITDITVITDQFLSANSKSHIHPLTHAIMMKQEAIALELLRRRSDPNIGYKEQTPLGLAIENGLQNVILALINSGADINAWHKPSTRITQWGHTEYVRPLALFLKKNDATIIQTFLSTKPSLHHIYKHTKTISGNQLNYYEDSYVTYQYSALCLLILINNSAPIPTFLDLDQEQSYPTPYNSKPLTPLQIAAQYGQSDCTKALAPTASKKNIKKAITYARKRKHQEIVDLLTPLIRAHDEDKKDDQCLIQ